MVRVYCWIFGRLAQQLFREPARLLQCGLCLLFVALKQVNRSFEESLRRYHGCARSSQGLIGKFFHDCKRFGKLALQCEKPKPYPRHRPIRVDTGWKRGN